MTVKRQTNIICILIMFISTVVYAETPKTIDQLLKEVQEQSAFEKKENVAREEI